jgi:hypothetical protein
MQNSGDRTDTHWADVVIIQTGAKKKKSFIIHKQW